MSRFMITGGFIGFAVVFVSGVMDGRNVLIVLRDSMIACLAMALLLRMLYRRIESSMASVLEREWRKESEQARAKAQGVQSENTPKPQADGKQGEK